jgi:hypothetical protein
MDRMLLEELSADEHVGMADGMSEQVKSERFEVSAQGLGILTEPRTEMEQSDRHLLISCQSFLFSYQELELESANLLGSSQ